MHGRFYKLFIFSASRFLVFLKVNLILIDISLLVEKMNVTQVTTGNLTILLDKINVYSKSIFRDFESY